MAFIHTFSKMEFHTFSFKKREKAKEEFHAFINEFFQKTKKFMHGYSPKFIHPYLYFPKNFMHSYICIFKKFSKKKNFIKAFLEISCILKYIF